MTPPTKTGSAQPTRMAPTVLPRQTVSLHRGDVAYVDHCDEDTEKPAALFVHGVLVNADTEAPFTYKDPCVELSPHVGGNPATAEEVRKAVVDFLQGLLKLG